MIIETNREITKAEAKEITNVLMSARQLIKHPSKKLSDMFAFCRNGAIFCTVALLFFGFVLIRGDRDALTLAGTIISVVAVVFLAVFYSGVKKTYQSLAKREKEHVIITFDENGIDFEVQGNRRIQTSWENVAFLRLFQETACFVPKEVTGFLISLGREHWEAVKEYVKENKIEIKIVE